MDLGMPLRVITSSQIQRNISTVISLLIKDGRRDMPRLEGFTPYCITPLTAFPISLEPRGSEKGPRESQSRPPRRHN